MVSKTNLQANCNCTKTVAKLNQKLLGNLIENLNSISYEPLILNQSLLSAIQQCFSKSEKTINDSSFQRNDQMLEFNPTNLNLKGTKLTNEPDFKYMQFTLISDKSKKTFKKSIKISTIKRQQFYTHHRKSLRKLAYIHTIEQTESQFMREQKFLNILLILQFAQT
jgi:hypothetical protein